MGILVLSGVSMLYALFYPQDTVQEFQQLGSWVEWEDPDLYERAYSLCRSARLHVPCMQK